MAEFGRFKCAAISFAPDGDNLPPVEVDGVHLRDEDGRHRLVERRAVHVDGGAHGQDESRHPLVDAQVVLQATERDGQGAGTAADREGRQALYFDSQTTIESKL